MASLRYKTGYKVLTAENKQLYSMITFRPKVRYIRGKSAYPHKGHGPLYVFKDLELAKYYANMEPIKQIYECTYIPSRVRHGWYRRFGRNICDNIIKKNNKSKDLASVVKLIKRVA
mgnify:CR=1 FL=1